MCKQHWWCRIADRELQSDQRAKGEGHVDHKVNRASVLLDLSAASKHEAMLYLIQVVKTLRMVYKRDIVTSLPFPLADSGAKGVL
jgi:hypothetical protein